MKISISDFEKAVEIGFEHGAKNYLAALLTPCELKVWINKAVLDAYNRIVPAPDED